jgi:Ca2+-binding EF-hand superfamily protein
LFQLALKEHHDNLRDFTFTHADGVVDPLPLGIPRGWLTLSKIPKAGTFKGHYECGADNRRVQLRQHLLATYGRRKLTQCDIKWWCSTAWLHPDVLSFVEFLTPRFDTMHAAFLEIDGPGGNGVVSLSEFLDALTNPRIKEMRCNRFRGDDEKQRLTAIFRYLDCSGEGEISEGEWQVLDQIFNEQKLAAKEFVDFITRTFNIRNLEGMPEVDWESAWEVLDEDESGEIDREEWAKACERLGFFGNIWPIYSFLDMDGEGTISPDEFFALQTYQGGKSPSRGTSASKQCLT